MLLLMLYAGLQVSFDALIHILVPSVKVFALNWLILTLFRYTFSTQLVGKRSPHAGLCIMYSAPAFIPEDEPSNLRQPC